VVMGDCWRFDMCEFDGWKGIMSFVFNQDDVME
jgi:hypothetical protein